MTTSQGTKRQHCELERENGGKYDWCEEATLDGNRPVVETVAQDGSPMDREIQHERSNCHQRTSTQLGRSCCQIDWTTKEICAKAVRCQGLQWRRWRQFHWKEAERDKWSGPHPQRFKIYRWKNMVAAEVSKLSGDADGFAESVQIFTGWLQFAQDRGRWRHCAKFGKSPFLVWPMRVRNRDTPDASRPQVRPACRCSTPVDAWTGADLIEGGGVDWLRLASNGGRGPECQRLRERESERLGEHLAPVSLHQTKLVPVLMSSWYSAGHGWSVTYHSDWTSAGSKSNASVRSAERNLGGLS